MVHILSFYSFLAERLFIDVVKIGSSEHAQDEVEMHHGD